LKKVALSLTVLFLHACSTEIEKNTNFIKRLVEIEFFTAEPNFDEIMVSYYEDKTGTYTLNPYTFSYDLNGDPLPFKITLENYTYKYIDGEAFRENHSPALLTVKLYIDGALILEDSSKGTAETFATVNFNYTIQN
jgi:hypothetical protein